MGCLVCWVFLLVVFVPIKLLLRWGAGVLPRDTTAEPSLKIRLPSLPCARGSRRKLSGSSPCKYRESHSPAPYSKPGTPALPYTPGTGASLVCQSGCAGHGQIVLLPFNPIWLRKSLPMQPHLRGSPGLLPRMAAVLWGNPAPATLRGGGNAPLQQEHYKQNSLPRW